MSSNYFAPEVVTTNMDSRKERHRIFGITGCNTAPTLEMEESVFDKVA
jgi:hypothetical protein